MGHVTLFDIFNGNLRLPYQSLNLSKSQKEKKNMLRLLSLAFLLLENIYN